MPVERIFSLEHGKLAYRADFVVYALVAGLLMAILIFEAPGSIWFRNAFTVCAGLGSWTAIEYSIHRYVLHGFAPFNRWHAAHHARPMALICAPTALSGSLIALLVFIPAWGIAGIWFSCALTLGVIVGYLVYGVTHHATHHWRSESGWLRDRKRMHALHHRPSRPGCYGVTTSFWDRVFRTGASGAPTGGAPP